jgi:hypothetical protein
MIDHPLWKMRTEMKYLVDPYHEVPTEAVSKKTGAGAERRARKRRSDERTLLTLTGAAVPERLVLPQHLLDSQAKKLKSGAVDKLNKYCEDVQSRWARSSGSSSAPAASSSSAEQPS